MISAEQEVVINQFLQSVRDSYEGEYPFLFKTCLSDSDRSMIAYRFLKARDWNTDNALKMLKASVAFREEKNAPSIDLFPSVFPIRGYDEEEICRTLHIPYTEKCKDADLWYRAIAPNHTVGIHYWDKERLPVIYDFIGSCRIKELFNSAALVAPIGQGPKDIILNYHYYSTLVVEKVLQYADMITRDKDGQRIVGGTVVVNAEGIHLGMITSQVQDVARAIIQMDQDFFPETLTRMLVINCPAIVTYIYNLLKSCFDKNTREKLVFCSKSTSLEMLKKFIDEDKIPKCVGGSCCCPGGCVPGVDSVCKNIRDTENIEPLTENVTIGARKEHVVEMELQPGDEVFWEFKCTKGRGGSSTDVLFIVSFVILGGDETLADITLDDVADTLPDVSSVLKKKDCVEFPTKAIKSENLTMDAGSFFATENGVLMLRWDNRSSWMQSKHLQLRTKTKRSTMAVPNA